MIIRGKLINCKREVKDFEGRKTKEMLFITLADVKLNKDKQKELEDCFKDAGKKFTPDWVKNFKGYVNLKTEYELPCKTPDGAEHPSVEKLITEDKFPFRMSDVKVSLNLKKDKNAIYPNSIIFMSEGEPYNPFAEFENDDED